MISPKQKMTLLSCRPNIYFKLFITHVEIQFLFCDRCKSVWEIYSLKKNLLDES